MLRSLGQFIRRVLGALIGLALVAGALALGVIVTTGLLLRLAWLRRSAGRAASPRGPAGAAAGSEVIDIEARELREAARDPYGFTAVTDPPAGMLRRP